MGCANFIWRWSVTDDCTLAAAYVNEGYARIQERSCRMATVGQIQDIDKAHQANEQSRGLQRRGPVTQWQLGKSRPRVIAAPAIDNCEACKGMGLPHSGSVSNMSTGNWSKFDDMLEEWTISRPAQTGHFIRILYDTFWSSFPLSKIKQKLPVKGSFRVLFHSLFKKSDSCHAD